MLSLSEKLLNIAKGVQSTNNDLHNTTQKITDWEIQTAQKTRGVHRCYRRV